MDEHSLSHYQDFIDRFSPSHTLPSSSLKDFHDIMPLAQKSGLLIHEAGYCRLNTQMISFVGIEVQEQAAVSVLLDLLGRKLFSSYTEVQGSFIDALEYALSHALIEYKKEGYFPLACGISIPWHLRTKFSRKDEAHILHRFRHIAISTAVDVECFLWAETSCDTSLPIVILKSEDPSTELRSAQWINGRPHTESISSSQITQLVQPTNFHTPVYGIGVTELSVHPSHYHPTEALAMGAAHMVELQIRRPRTFTPGHPALHTVTSSLFTLLFP